MNHLRSVGVNTVEMWISEYTSLNKEIPWGRNAVSSMITALLLPGEGRKEPGEATEPTKLFQFISSIKGNDEGGYAMFQ